MSRFGLINVLAGLVLLASCNSKEVLEMDEYIKYVENPENGLRQEKQIGNMVYMVQYKPLEYMAAREYKKPGLEASELKKRVDEMSDLQCYTLRLMASDKKTDVGTFGLSSTEQYNARNGYMSFDMQNDIYLLEGNDTLGCGLFHYINNYGLAPYADFVIAFENRGEQSIHDKTFIYEDKVFGGGMVKFQIRKEDIQNIPSLKTN